MNHKSRHPIKSVGDDEIAAAAEAIDEGKILKSSFFCTALQLVMSLRLLFALDSRDLFTSLRMQQNSVYQSICPESSINECETHDVDHTVWIPVRVNLTGPGTNTDILLSVALQLR